MTFFYDYSTVRVNVNRKTRIKRAKNRMQVRILKNLARARTTLKYRPH